MVVKIGTAGWSIPRHLAAEFPAEGTALDRYRARFAVTEINSSFHRPHRLSTWQRWHDSVPNDFRFSVKLPKVITHELKLIDCSNQLDQFLAQASVLQRKLGVLLVQLPPKLAFDEKLTRNFFAHLSSRTDANIACEPRHPSWFTPAVEIMLEQLRVARVAPDPAICDAAAAPGGWAGLRYWRLHGSPVVYRSSYRDRIDAYASTLKDEAAHYPEVWCILDNTASSAGAGDALALMQAIHSDAHR
jgi:uncharacterized protein YecE (DUF72 family)